MIEIGGQTFQEEYPGQVNVYRDIRVGKDGPQGFGRFFGDEKIRLDFFADSIKPYPSPRVVDIGCNIGTVLRLLIERGVIQPENATGLDIDRQYIEFAKTYVPGVTFVVSALEYAQEDLQGDFDVVIAGEVIEHVTDLDRAFVVLASLLKEGGTLAVSTPDAEASDWAKTFCRDFPDRHRQCLTEGMLREQCDKNGLRVTSVVHIAPRPDDGFAYFMLRATKE